MARIDKVEVLRRVDLAALMTELLGPPKQMGGKLNWRSPVAVGTGKTPPCHIRGSNSHGVEFWHDFHSDLDGNAIDLLLLINPSLDFKAALEQLATRAGVTEGRPLPAAPYRQPIDRTSTTPASDEFRDWVRWCQQALSNTPDGTNALGWLERKGFKPDLVIAAGIGFDIGHWRTDEWDKDRRVSHGISGASGIVYPIRDGQGVVQYAQTRNLDWHPDSEYPKYFNPKGITNPHVGHWIGAGTTGAPVVVVEGPSDALAAWSASNNGDEFSVAALIGAGVAQRSDVIDTIINRWSNHPIVVATDPDAAGRRAADVLITAFTERGNPVARLNPVGGDIADWQLHAPNFAALFRDAVNNTVHSSTIHRTTQKHTIRHRSRTNGSEAMQL